MNNTIIRFPKMFNINTKSFEVIDSSKAEYYVTSIRMILKTTLGSLYGDVSYGTPDFILSSASAISLETVKKQIEVAIKTRIPELANLSAKDIELYSNDGINFFLNIKLTSNTLQINLNELLK